MSNTENRQDKELVCSKCGEIIKPGELVFSMSLNVGTPDDNNSLVIRQSKTITTICFNCSSFILAEEITLSSEMMPWLKEDDGDNEEEDDDMEEGDETFEDMLMKIYHIPRSDKDFAFGLHFSEQRDWERAINSFSSVIELEPDNAYAYDGRGIAYGSIGCCDQAISDFDTAISINNTVAGFYCNRGLSYYKKSMFDEAIADLDKAIELDTDVAVFYNNRGLAHRWREDYVSAVEDLDKAIKLDTDSIETHKNRGEVYAILGEYKKALADFDRELEINPNDADAFASRVTVLDEINHGCKNNL